MKKSILAFIIATPLILMGCSNNKSSTASTQSNDTESAQQLGDAMASIDESGDSTGKIAFNQSIEKIYHRVSPEDMQKPFWKDVNFVTPAYAASCLAAATFGTCDTVNHTLVRTFSDCTFFFAKYDGTISLLWSGPTVTNCELGGAGDAITRSPDFTITGLFGGKYTVAKTGAHGQVLTWDSGTTDLNKTFKFSNDGIQRTFVKGSTTLFDFTTETTADITITGTKRTHRVIDGGGLKVTNNKTSVSCTYVPDNVTWSSATCNCPEDGTWTGTCSNGKSAKLELTGCGTGTVTSGTTTVDVELDRCGKI